MHICCLAVTHYLMISYARRRRTDHDMADINRIWSGWCVYESARTVLYSVVAHGTRTARRHATVSYCTCDARRYGTRVP